MPFLFLSLPLSLFFAQYLFLSPLCWFKSYWWTWLLFLQSPCSNSLTCCLIDGVLVCTHWAFDYRHPPPSASATHTHTHTQIQNTISVWLGQKQKLFFLPLTAVICVCWQRFQKRLDKEASYPMTAFFLLQSSPSIHTYPANTHTRI